MTFEAEGGCLCGAVRYRVSGSPYHQTHCHCTLCRRASGAPFVTWFSVAREGFLVTQGKPCTTARHRRQFEGSADGAELSSPSSGTICRMRSTSRRAVWMTPKP